MSIDLGTLVPGLARIAALTGRPVPTRWPQRVEDSYRVELVSIVAQMPGYARHILAALPVERRDADDDDDVAARVEADFTRDVADDVSRAARRGVNEADAAAKASLRIQLGARADRMRVDPFANDPDLDRALAAAVKRNVKSFGKIPRRFFAATREAISDGVRRGLTADGISEFVERRVFSGARGSELAIARGFAASLARNEIGRITSDITRHRQTRIGLKRYRWVTSRDERVRGNPAGHYPDAVPSHFARDGKVFDWDDPPAEDDSDGHPGEPPNCRCIAEPVIEEIDAGEDETPGPSAFSPLAFTRR